MWMGLAAAPCDSVVGVGFEARSKHNALSCKERHTNNGM